MSTSLKFFLLSRSYEQFLVTALRLGLGLIFIWFGLLKVFGFNPVFDLIYHSLMPWLAADVGLIVLGVGEFIIGLLLCVNRFLVFTHSLVFLHLVGTFSTFIFGWTIIFDPYFPVLSIDGEFVIKNIILALSGLVVLTYELRKKS